MKLILALGNPGDRYRDTRHNVGWWLADRLVSAWSFPPFRARRRALESAGRAAGEHVRLWKPATLMNRSGQVLREATLPDGWSAPEDLLVLVDDVALDPGRFRLRARGSSGGHRGLASVEEALGTRDYARLRIGVGEPHDERIDLADWVLAPMPAAQEERVLETFGSMVEAVECWISEGVETAMNRYN